MGKIGKGVEGGEGGEVTPSVEPVRDGTGSTERKATGSRRLRVEELAQ